MTDTLRHGFKAEAERIALATRAELGLSARDRLDALLLAEHLAIPVVSLRDLQAGGARAESVACLLSTDAGFSALTVCCGTRRLVVYNPAHPPGRRANSVAHELSHVILEHPPEPMIGLGGCRRWNVRMEAEADWLASTLLVPRDAAFW